MITQRHRRQFLWWAVQVAWVVSFSVCIEPALFGTRGWNLSGLGGVAAGAVTQWNRNGDYRALSPEQRRRVDAAVETGRPTGTAKLDVAARARLCRMAQVRTRSNAVVAAVMLVLASAVPVVATVRMHNGWYLLAGVPIAAQAVLVLAVHRRPHPADRLAQLDAALAGAP